MKHLLVIAMLALAANVWGETNEFATAEVIVGIYTSPVFSAGGDITATNELVTGSASLVHALFGDITIDTNNCRRTLTDEGIRKLAADGRICEALGRHFWRPGRPGEGEGSIGGNAWYADYHPGTTYRTCSVCGKCESKTEGAWK